MHRSCLAGFIIDCKTDDLPSATAFWSKALAMSIVERDASYERLDGTQRGLNIEVQRVPHESRVHLDIASDDVDAEVARLEKLGAKRVAQVRTWWVMEAPTGQRFCVVRAKSLEDLEGATTWT